MSTETLGELKLDCLEDMVLLEQEDRYCSNVTDQPNGSLKPTTQRQLRQVQQICLFKSGLHGCNYYPTGDNSRPLASSSVPDVECFHHHATAECLGFTEP